MFISYGDSDNEIHHLIIGKHDFYENYKLRRLFPILLENYINEIESIKILNDTISTQLMRIEKKASVKRNRKELIIKNYKEIKVEIKYNVNVI